MSRADRLKNDLDDDIDSIIERLDKIQRGKVPRVDCYATTMDGIKRTLRGVKDSIDLAIINSKD